MLISLGLWPFIFSISHSWQTRSVIPSQLISVSMALPRERKFQTNQIEILRVLGRIDVEVTKGFLDNIAREKSLKIEREQRDVDLTKITETGRATTIRIFEARTVDGTRCYLKEFLPLGLALV